MVVLVVDVVCGPLLTAILANPLKSRRERWVDFSLVGLIQAVALTFGLHSVWIARPAVLAYETDRFVIVTANEISPDSLAKAPEGMRRLPWWGLVQVGTRRPVDLSELLDSVERGLAGQSPAMQPEWWVPWGSQLDGLRAHAKPLQELIPRRPAKESVLRAAAQATGIDIVDLRYLPMTSSKSKDWIALLSPDLRIVGYAPVDGF